MPKNSSKFEFFVQITWHLLLEKSGEFFGQGVLVPGPIFQGGHPPKNLLDQT